MKKITIIFMMLLVATFGFAQAELVTNGDFETGTGTPWTGNAVNPILQGSNYVNQADVQAAGDAFAVNISQEIILESGKTYLLTFDAFTDASTGTRSMIAGLGQTGAPFDSVTFLPELTSTTQTFSRQLTIGYGDDVTDRVLFDMGAEVGFVFIDNVSVIEVQSTCNNGTQDGDETGVDCGGSCAPCITPPATAAPTPSEPASDVFSIYSDAYTTAVSFDNFDAGWCGAATTEIDIASNNTLQKNDGIGCHGIEFQSDKQDLSAYTNLRIDFYTKDTDLVGKVFNLKLVDFGGGSAEASALEVKLNTGTTPAVVTGQWVSVDVDITALSAPVANSLTRTDIAQMGITSNLTNVWYDNIYLYSNVPLSNTDFAQAEFKAYPNPARAAWTIQTTEDMKAVQVYTISGSLVRDLEVNASKTVISTEGLSSGVYLAKISNGSDQTKTIKLIKE